MARSQATFALLQPPSFDVLPDTDVQLGTIHPRAKTKPRGPDTKRLLNRMSRVPVPAALSRTREDPSVILEGGQLRSGGAGIDIHLPFLEGIGGKIGGEASTETVLYINAEDVETQWFQPDDAYFAQALKGVAIRKELSHFRRPSVFMVTGVKSLRAPPLSRVPPITPGRTLLPQMPLYIATTEMKAVHVGHMQQLRSTHSHEEFFL